MAGLCRTYMFSIPPARAVVRSFIELNGLKFVSIGESEFDLAAQAYAEFGKGRHPAALNMGDCFAYACAKANRAKLLFKGEVLRRLTLPRPGEESFPRSGVSRARGRREGIYRREGICRAPPGRTLPRRP
jgi:ribonuclease VapC